ncbi:MAG: outer membrane beta-barrel protein [Prevotella sp.]
MRRLTLVMLLAMLFVRLCAQQVSGVVTDANNGGLGLANIVVLSADSTFLSGTTSDNNGNFTLKQPQQGNIIKISLIGYETKFLQYAGEERLTVQLTEKAFQLGEAIIHGQLPQTILKGEGMTTIVAGSVLEKTTSIDQLLDFIPHVSMQNGKVEVLGRGTPEIYINGKRMMNQMELERLNPENVKSVEVITNPGARYNKSITSVLRITTKQIAGEGFGFDSKTVGSINEQRRTSGFETLKLNWRKGGWDVNAHAYGAHTHTQDNTSLRLMTFLNDTWQQQLDIDQEYGTTRMYLSLASSYSIDNNTSIGASVDYDRETGLFARGSSHSENFRNGEKHDEMNGNHALNGNKSEVSTNAYFVGKIGKLGIDFNSDYYWKKESRPMYNDERYKEEGQTETHRLVNSKQNNASRLFANKLVLSFPLAKGEFSVGGEYSHSRRKNLYSVLPTGVVDDENNRIKENIASVFMDYSKQFGKVGLQVGLRYERVGFNYYERDVLVHAQSKRYADWFPSLTLSFPVHAVQMQLSYSSDINRPSFQKLRSGVQFDNRFTYESGNPFLLPAISRNLSYALSWKWISLSAMFARVSNQACYIMQPYKDDPTTTLLRPENMPTYNKVQASLSLSPSWGVWHPSLETMFYKQCFKMQTHQGGSINHPLVSFNLTNTFDTKWFTVSFIMRTRTEGNTENMFLRKGSFGSDLSLYKSCLGGKLLLQLYASDIFGTEDQHVVLYSGELRTSYLSKFSSSTIKLTLRYRFNTSKSKYQGTGAGKSQKNRM